jgi:cytochrome P450
MQAICVLLGIPEEDRHRLFECVEHIFDLPNELDYMAMNPQRAAAASDLFEYGAALIDEKRRHPRDDMLSVVIHAQLADENPPALTDGELSAFFSLLFSAGAETTRNAIAGSLLAFMEDPQQLTALREDAGLLPSAVGRRGDSPLDDAVAIKEADGHSGVRTGRASDSGGRQSPGMGRLGQS